MKLNQIDTTRSRSCFSLFPFWGGVGFASPLPFTTPDSGQPQQGHGDAHGDVHGCRQTPAIPPCPPTPPASQVQLPALWTLRQSCHSDFIARSFQESPNQSVFSISEEVITRWWAVVVLFCFALHSSHASGYFGSPFIQMPLGLSSVL